MLISRKCSTMDRGYICCVFAACWTIIQSGAHLYGIFYVAWWRKCSTIDQDPKPLLMFLSDIFTAECKNETAGNLLLKAGRDLFLLNSTDDSVVRPSLDSETLDQLVLVYMILDALWIVSAVALLMGTVCHIRQTWALAFYFPWVVLDVTILLYDAFCAVYFGLHIPNTGSLKNWFSFLGVTLNIADIKVVRTSVSSLVSEAITIIMMFIASRGVVIWVVNLVLIVIVVRVGLQAYKKKFTTETSRRYRRPFSASTRIRNWYLFYGSLERKTVEGNNNKNDMKASNYERTSGDFVYSQDKPGVNSIDDRLTQTGNVDTEEASGVSRRGKNTQDVLDNAEAKNVTRLNELRGQLPWSYVEKREELFIKNKRKNSNRRSRELRQEDKRNYEASSKF